MTRILVGLALICASAFAQGFEYWPGAVYDSRVPSVRKVLGYESGERITTHANILKYFEALAAAAPGRVKLFEYAESWEGRKLIYAAVGSEANLRKLGEIKAGMQRLRDARKTGEADAQRLMAGLPAVIWLGYGVHGDEISSPDAAMLTAYHLLAARGDKLVDAVLANVLVLIDPAQNPDGRDGFVSQFERNRGLEPDASPAAAERNQAWPGNRSNHYLFDMNRDWFALTQPETRGRVKALREWYPLVFADLHEMSAESTYFFSPESEPYNPHLAKDQREDLKLFGKNNSKWFDQYGFDYFTREVYDAYYPGYGASWPAYFGSIAMTYEQASARGLIVRRNDGTVLRFRDSVRRHFVASLSTAETAAANRKDLLEHFYRYQATAIQEGSTESVKEYLISREREAPAADKLAGLLVEQGVEVRRATAGFRAGDREYPAGTYSVILAQPAKRLIRTLLDTDSPMAPAFLKAEEERRRKRLRGEIYDVTAWSLPLMFNVEAVARPEVSQGQFEALKGSERPAGAVSGKAKLAYVAAWNTASARLLAAALREGLSVFSADKGFTLAGRKYPSGTLIFKRSDNPAALHETLVRLAAASGAAVEATDSGWIEEGVNFGSRHVVHLRKPEVAMAWDVPASSGAAGATRFVLERQIGYPVTVVRTAQLATADLSKFQVIILPDQGQGGRYTTVLGTAVEKLKAWVDAGGTLIGLADAVGFLADPKVNLLAISQENATRAETPKKPEPLPDGRAPGKILATEEDLRKAILPDQEPPDVSHGVLVRARVNPDHWLAAGVPATVHALVEGRAIYTPIKLDKGVNVGLFEGPEKLVASGYLWEENRKQLAWKPLVVVQPQGRGFVVGFTADPNYRAYMDGMNLLFVNAVFRGLGRGR